MAQTTCKNCGYPWSTYSACPNCGSKSPSTDTKNQPKGLGCFILGIFCLILIAAIGEAFSYGFMDDYGSTIIVVGTVIGLFILVKSQNNQKKTK